MSTTPPEDAPAKLEMSTALVQEVIDHMIQTYGKSPWAKINDLVWVWEGGSFKGARPPSPRLLQVRVSQIVLEHKQYLPTAWIDRVKYVVQVHGIGDSFEVDQLYRTAEEAAEALKAEVLRPHQPRTISYGHEVKEQD